jgi:hypothetical protein
LILFSKETMKSIILVVRLVLFQKRTKSVGSARLQQIDIEISSIFMPRRVNVFGFFLKRTNNTTHGKGCSFQKRTKSVVSARLQQIDIEISSIFMPRRANVFGSFLKKNEHHYSW